MSGQNWQEPEAVYIEVKDDGVGIDPEDQKRVFERFFQGGQGKKPKNGRNRPGTVDCEAYHGVLWGQCKAYQ